MCDFRRSRDIQASAATFTRPGRRFPSDFELSAETSLFELFFVCFCARALRIEEHHCPYVLLPSTVVERVARE